MYIYIYLFTSIWKHDASASGFSVTEERSRFVDFLPAGANSHFAISLRRPTSEDVSMRNYIDEFTLPSWTVLFLMFIISWCSMIVLTYCNLPKSNRWASFSLSTQFILRSLLNKVKDSLEFLHELQNAGLILTYRGRQTFRIKSYHWNWLLSQYWQCHYCWWHSTVVSFLRSSLSSRSGFQSIPSMIWQNLIIKWCCTKMTLLKIFTERHQKAAAFNEFTRRKLSTTSYTWR